MKRLILSIVFILSFLLIISAVPTVATVTRSSSSIRPAVVTQTTVAPKPTLVKLLGPRTSRQEVKSIKKLKSLASVHTETSAFLENEPFIVWQRIDWCEAGHPLGWKSYTYTYPDGLGIDRQNWVQFGGKINGPSSPQVQIQVEIRFLTYYHMSLPDQNGYCHAY